MRPRRVRYAKSFKRSYLKFPAETRQMISAAVAAFMDRSREQALQQERGSEAPCFRLGLGTD